MTTLYNCRHSGDQYRITKFDIDMNVESTYTCTTSECDCPAGVRPTCRHRDMLPRFIQRQHINDEWFFDYDRGGWVQMGDEWIAAPPLTTKEILSAPQHNNVPIIAVESLDPTSPAFMKRRFL